MTSHRDDHDDPLIETAMASSLIATRTYAAVVWRCRAADCVTTNRADSDDDGTRPLAAAPDDDIRLRRRRRRPRRRRLPRRRSPALARCGVTSHNRPPGRP